jgi:hypothetical protein
MVREGSVRFVRLPCVFPDAGEARSTFASLSDVMVDPADVTHEES